MPEPLFETRLLTRHEQQLITWMLEHASNDASALLPQLELARATSWRCPCGCASFNIVLEGRAAPVATTRMKIVADFDFGPDDQPYGIFLFEKGGLLAGLEVYGLAGDAPKSLPQSEALRPFGR
jgi:hypothetical protein